MPNMPRKTSYSKNCPAIIHPAQIQRLPNPRNSDPTPSFWTIIFAPSNTPRLPALCFVTYNLTLPKMTCLAINEGNPAYKLFHPTSTFSFAITPNVPSRPNGLYTLGSATARILAASIGVSPKLAMIDATAPDISATPFTCATANASGRRCAMKFLKKV
ncbi:hypothetical protein ACHAWO_012841 [Cyclotella atomus]|uniref:Uncharacterized protein n=1 Tax=Cyclotella atomus TaxID=382360 RepID=A0ABD3MZR9_9STRA